MGKKNKKYRRWATYASAGNGQAETYFVCESQPTPFDQPAVSDPQAGAVQARESARQLRERQLEETAIQMTQATIENRLLESDWHPPTRTDLPEIGARERRAVDSRSRLAIEPPQARYLDW